MIYQVFFLTPVDYYIFVTNAKNKTCENAKQVHKPSSRSKFVNIRTVLFPSMLQVSFVLNKN